jgi:Domain of unknown function (DUF4189)
MTYHIRLTQQHNLKSIMHNTSSRKIIAQTLLLSALALGAPHSQAQENSFYNQSSMYYQQIDNTANQQRESNTRSYIENSRNNSSRSNNNDDDYDDQIEQSSSSKAMRQNNFIALSYSPKTGYSGWAWNKDSPDEALKHSLINCAEKDCKWLISAHERCVALAVDVTERHAAAGTGSTDQEAINQSKKECAKIGSQCTARYIYCPGYGAYQGVTDDYPTPTKQATNTSKTLSLSSIQKSLSAALGTHLQPKINANKKLNLPYIKIIPKQMVGTISIYTMHFYEHPNNPIPGNGHIIFLANKKDIIVAWKAVWNGQNLCQNPDKDGICYK